MVYFASIVCGDPQSGRSGLDKVLTTRAATQMCRTEGTTTAEDTRGAGGRTWRRVVPPCGMVIVTTTIARIRARRARPNLKASAKTRALDEAFRRKAEET